jgi:heavy metal sensor kinase
MWFGGVFLAGWVLFGVSMWVNLRQTLTNERHQTLARRLDRLQELLVKDQTATDADRAEDLKDFAHATGNGLAEVYRADGGLAYPAPSAAAKGFPWPGFAEDANVFQRVQSAGQSYWVMGRSFTSGGSALELMAAAPEAGNLLVMQSFLNGMLGWVPAVLVISCAAGYWVSRRALRPVDRIAATARSISIRNISERVPVSATGDELQRLAETCNAMLERLESSVNQMKRFTADASHELRGPLSFARTVAEVALRRREADGESRRAFVEIVDEMARAADLLDQMLTLARADSAPVSEARKPVALRELVDEVCGAAQSTAWERGLTLTWPRLEGPATVLGEASALRRLVWILVDNAVKYSRADGRIDVVLREADGEVRLEVRDDGIGIAAGDLPHVFERFYRADPSRGVVEGTGLGLAIAQWIAETHEAAISVTSEEGVGTCFAVVFAAAASTMQDQQILLQAATA